MLNIAEAVLPWGNNFYYILSYLGEFCTLEVGEEVLCMARFCSSLSSPFPSVSDMTLSVDVLRWVNSASKTHLFELLP